MWYLRALGFIVAVILASAPLTADTLLVPQDFPTVGCESPPGVCF